MAAEELLGDAYIQVTADTSELSANLAEAREETDRFGQDATQSLNQTRESAREHTQEAKGLRNIVGGLNQIVASGTVGFGSLRQVMTGVMSMIGVSVSTVISAAAALGSWFVAINRIKKALEESQPHAAEAVDIGAKYASMVNSIVEGVDAWTAALHRNMVAQAQMNSANEEVIAGQQREKRTSIEVRRATELAEAGEDEMWKKRINAAYDVEQAELEKNAVVEKANRDRDNLNKQILDKDQEIVYKRERLAELQQTNTERQYEETMKVMQERYLQGGISLEAFSRKKEVMSRQKVEGGKEADSLKASIESLTAEVEADKKRRERYNSIVMEASEAFNIRRGQLEQTEAVAKLDPEEVAQLAGQEAAGLVEAMRTSYPEKPPTEAFRTEIFGLADWWSKMQQEQGIAEDRKLQEDIANNSQRSAELMEELVALETMAQEGTGVFSPGGV